MYSLENNFLLNSKSLNDFYLLHANQSQLSVNLSNILFQHTMQPYLSKRNFNSQFLSTLIPSTKKVKTEKVQVLISNADPKTDTEINIFPTTQRFESSSSLKIPQNMLLNHTNMNSLSGKSHANLKTEQILSDEIHKTKHSIEINPFQQEKAQKIRDNNDLKSLKNDEEKEIYFLTEKYNSMMSELKSMTKQRKKEYRKMKKRLQKHEGESSDEISENDISRDSD